MYNYNTIFKLIGLRQNKSNIMLKYFPDVIIVGFTKSLGCCVHCTHLIINCLNF